MMSCNRQRSLSITIDHSLQRHQREHKGVLKFQGGLRNLNRSELYCIHQLYLEFQGGLGNHESYSNLRN